MPASTSDAFEARGEATRDADLDIAGDTTGDVVPRAVRLLDGAVDGLVVAFALWTLVYECVLAAQVSAFVPVALWLVVAIVVVVGVSWLAARRVEAPHGDPVMTVAQPRNRLRPLARTVLPAYTGLVALAVLLRDPLGVVPLVLLAVVGLVVVLLRRRTPSGSRPIIAPVKRRDVRARDHGAAAAISVALGVLALFLVRPDADDVFYVNRGTWVADHGVPSLRDTMFGPETLASSYGGGLPLTSVETLYGALAHLLGVRNGTMTYLVAVPVLGFLVGWVMWRLLRAWAPSRPLTAFVLAIAFVLLSAESVVGNYSIGRIWQGKVTATCILLPIVLVHLTRLLERTDRWSHVVLLAAGVTFVGLTSAAPLMAMPIAGASLLAALLVRSARLAVGAAWFLLAPLVAGVVVALGPADVGGEAPAATSAPAAFTILLGPQTALVLLGVAALLAVGWTVRGSAAVLAGCCVLAAFAALLPGVFDAVNLATGAGPVAWRLLLVAPLAALMGLLGAATVSWWTSPGHTVEGTSKRPVWFGSRLLGWAAAVVVATVVAASGTPQWSGAVDARLTATPEWKLDGVALDDVEAASELKTGPGPWMLPAAQMSALSVWTTTRFALVPRSFYLSGLAEPDAVTAARLRLFRVWQEGAQYSAAKVGADLLALGVSLACVPSEDGRLVQTLSRATRDPDLVPVGTMLCHTPPWVGVP